MKKKILEMTNNNYDQILLHEEKPVFIDFFSNYCIPCKLAEPIFENVADEFMENAVFAKVDVETSMEIADKFDVSFVPTIVVVRNGELVQKIIGLRPKTEIQEVLKNIM